MVSAVYNSDKHFVNSILDNILFENRKGKMFETFRSWVWGLNLSKQKIL